MRQPHPLNPIHSATDIWSTHIPHNKFKIISHEFIGNSVLTFLWWDSGWGHKYSYSHINTHLVHTLPLQRINASTIMIFLYYLNNSLSTTYWRTFLKREYIPDICQFWDTAAFLSPVKVHKKVRKFALCAKNLPEKSTPPPVVAVVTNISHAWIFAVSGGNQSK